MDGKQYTQQSLMELATRQQGPIGSTENSNLQKNTIKNLFAVMSLAYPKFIEEKDAIPAMRLWYQELGQFDDATIEAAQRIMTDRYATFAPRVGEFKALCREVSAQVERKQYLAIPMAEMCSNCRSMRTTEHHRINCVESKEKG